MSKIINFNQAKKEIEHKQTFEIKKSEALSNVEKAKMSSSDKFNYEFYCLLDLFMQENYPCYVAKFNDWLEKINKNN